MSEILLYLALIISYVLMMQPSEFMKVYECLLLQKKNSKIHPLKVS